MKMTKEQKEELDYCKNLLKEQNIDFKYKEILGPSRKAELVFIRALIVIILRKKGYSLHKTGHIINRDHATIVHLQKYTRKQGRNKKYFAIIKDLTIKINKGDALNKIEYHLDEIIRLLEKFDVNTPSISIDKLKLIKNIIITEQ